MEAKSNQLRHAAKKLPVYQHKEAFLNLLNANQALVVVGETGSGKTTQIPQWCYESIRRKSERQKVACTQPRRIAAMSVSGRVAEELGVQLGEEVGYSVRFEARVSAKTKLKYLTDGMLLREAILDPNLNSYAIIILDEAHERTLQTEILMGVIKRALNERNKPESKQNNLKVVVMSATIDVKLFKKYFNCPSLSIGGRQFPVQDMFAETKQTDLLTSTLITVFQIHRTSDAGDILVFCSGQDEIQSLVTLCKRTLKEAPDNLKNLTPLPLYASLPAAHQMKVFKIETNANDNNSNTNHTQDNGDGQTSNLKSWTRRVIFSTNVAETSVTIPNIKFVIDTGKVKSRSYCPKTGMDYLKVISISKSQASQRSGRAGRTSAGTCYRLYTSDEYEDMIEHQLPEIERCNLDSVILQMISMGIKSIKKFEFLQRPDELRILAALRQLLTLKAIKIIPNLLIYNKSNNNNTTNDTSSSESNTGKTLSNNITIDNNNLLNLEYELTSIGKKLSTFPISPSMGRILLAANELKCLDEAITIISLLYIENLFHIPPRQRSKADTILRKFHTNEGDLIMYLRVFRAFRKNSTLNKSNIKQWCTDHYIHQKNIVLAIAVRKQLTALCRDLNMQASSCGRDTSVVRRALVYGLFNNCATMWNGKYRNRDSDEIHIHPSSCLFRTRPETILYAELVETNKRYMRGCTLIDMNWVREVSGQSQQSATSSGNSTTSASA